MNHEFENLKRENTRLRSLQEESVRLLTVCSTQVGTVIGESISEHLATVKGVRHNAAAWDMADRNGEQ